MMVSQPPCLQVIELTYHVGALKVVDQVNVCVAHGQILGLIGPNGAGKTTVIDLISGLTRVDRGAVILNGKDVTGQTPDSRTRRGLARTFQESPAVPGLSTFEHLQLASEATARRQTGAMVSPEALLDRFGLRSVRDVAGAELPPTQRRLLDFARAIATRPDVLLLDEPFAGLASHEVEVLVKEIMRLKDQGVSVVVVEHRLALLNRVVDSAAALVNGTLVATGRLNEVLANPVVREAFLGGGDKQMRKDNR